MLQLKKHCFTTARREFMKKALIKVNCIILVLVFSILVSPLVIYAENDVEDLTFDSSLFETDSAFYNHELCRYASRIVVNSNRNIIKTLMSLKNNFGAFADTNYFAYNTDRDEENFFIVHYDISVEGKKYRTLVVCLSGSTSEQWNSNFDPYGLERKQSYAGDSEKGVTHLGFADARDYVYGYLKNYIDQYCSSYDIKLLITGHSRGAAAANLLAAKIIKEKSISGKSIDEKNVYTYTFATPNNTSAPDLKDPMYDRIFNIVNPEDLITKLMPSAWGFCKYGTTYSFVSKSNCEPISYNYEYLAAMNTYYSNCFNSEYINFNEGELPTDILMDKLSNEASSLDDYYNKKMLEGTSFETTLFGFLQNYFCPFVNGSISGSDNIFEILGTLSDILNESDDNSIINSFINFFIKYQVVKNCFSCAHDAATYYAYTMCLDENVLTREKSSVIYRLYNVDTVEVTEATTNIICSQVINRSVNSKISSKNYSIATIVEKNCIVLRIPTNRKFTISIYPSAQTTVDCVIDKYVSGRDRSYRNIFFDLSVSDEKSGKFYTENADSFFRYNDSQETIYPSYSYQYSQLPTININYTVEGLGSVEGKTSGLLGDWFTLKGSADGCNSFLGWYENDSLVTKNKEFGSLLKNDIQLTSKFTENYFFFKNNCSIEGNVVYGLPEGIENMDDFIEISGFECKYDNMSSLGTDSKLDFVLGDETIESYYISIQGDLNGDGYVDAFDVSVMTAIVNMEKSFDEGTASFIAADIYKDGVIDAFDLILLISMANFV